MLAMLVVIPNIEDATSLYRATGPLGDLRRNFDINLYFMDSVGENRIDLVDLAFMQRPSSENHLKIAQMCVDNGIPLWVDYDDLLLDVPQDNPAFEQYMSQETRGRVIKIIQMASVVTVSTEQLKRCLQPKGYPLNKRVYVVNNAFPDKFLKLAKPFSPKKHVNWRGSNTHMRDLSEYAPEIIDLAKERPDTTFTFVGYNPWFVTQYIRQKQAIVCPPMSPGEYFRFMASTNPSVQYVPLHRSMFNLCKSNIAWLEASFAGAICVAPGWHEWKNKPGVLAYKDPADFKIKMELALDEPAMVAEAHRLGWEFIKDEMLLSKVNSKRFELIEALADERAGKDSYPPGGAPLDEETVMELE